MGDTTDIAPDFERLDLDMSNPADREIMRNLRRARSEKLAGHAYYEQLKQAGKAYTQKLEQDDIDHER